MPLAVQACRLALGLYSAGLLWAIWDSRSSATISGVITLGTPASLSLLALVYSFRKTRLSRWLLAAVVLLVPVSFWSTSLLLGIFTWPSWWEWPLVLPVMLGLPAAIAIGLFLDKQSDGYFAHKA